MTATPRETRDDTDRRGGMGTLALALGLIAAGTCWVGLLPGWPWMLGWIGIVLGLVAIGVGFVESRKAFHDPHRSGGAALTGLALGLIGLVIGAIIVVPVLFGVGQFGAGLTLDECLAQAKGSQEERMCASQHLDEYKARYGDPGTVG